MSPYYTEDDRITNLMYTVDHTFGHCSQKFIGTCTKSSAHAHGTEIRGGNFKTSSRTHKVMDGSQLTHKVIYKMSDGNAKTDAAYRG